MARRSVARYTFRKSKAQFKILFVFLLLVLYTLFSLYLASFFIHYFYIKELNEENCECSKDWKQKWVQYGPVINIIIGYILVFIQYKLLFLKRSMSKLGYLIPLIFSIIYIAYIYKLIETNCLCSDNWKRDFILYFTIFVIIYQLLGIFLSLA